MNIVKRYLHLYDKGFNKMTAKECGEFSKLIRVIEELIDDWHSSDSQLSVYRYLGCSWQEYEKYHEKS